MITLGKIIQEEFQNKEFFTKKELAIGLKKYNLTKSDNALRQDIYKLNKAGKIQSIKRGIYTCRIKPVYKPKQDNYLTQIRRLFTKEYPEIKYCIWSSRWLNDFMTHQVFSHFYIFEVENDMLETTFNYFTDNNKNAFLNPDKDIVENYVSKAKNPVIIKKLPVRSPVYKLHQTVYPKPEKILVDIFKDELFYFYQGNELANIFYNFTESYHLNYSTLLTYAAQRNTKKEIKSFLMQNTKINKYLVK